MPRESREPQVTGPALHRRELIAQTEGQDIQAGDVVVRLSNVPLFRATGDGSRQAIRVRTDASITGEPLTVSILRDDAVLDELVIATDVASSEFLLVPEVTADTRHEVAVRRGGDPPVTVPFDVAPQRKWTVHLVHHSHYDIGYTDPQHLVLGSQLAFIDDALDLVAATDEWPNAARFRWSIEVAWPLRHWLRTRPQSAIDMLVRRVQEGRIEINALPFSMHTEAFSFDELARQFDILRDLRTEYGLDVVTAMQTDVPGATVGLASLLTDAGIRFLAVAHNYAGRSIPHLLDGQALTRPFYWQAPNGNRVLVWYTDTLHGSAYMETMTIGFGHGYDDVVMGLPEYLNAVAQRAYPYGQTEHGLTGSLHGVEYTRDGYPFDLLHLRVQGEYGDNAPPSLLPSTIVREWNETWTYPRLQMSTSRAFMEDAERRLAGRIDSFAGDWTDWWADGIGSGAVVLGRNRASQASIRTAQTLNALAGALGDPPPATLASEVRTAYEEMALFDEHTWGASDPWGTDLEQRASGETQWQRKAGFALAAEERVSSLSSGGVERIARLALPATVGAAGEALAVVNPNSWNRTDLARVFIPRHAWLGTSAALIEADTGRRIPFTEEPQAHPQHRPQGTWLHFLAENVPAFGYIRYNLIDDPAAIMAVPEPTPELMLRNDHFAIELDLGRGCISRLEDRATGRDLVDTSAPFGFNAFIHDRYTSGTGFNHLSSRLGRAEAWLLGSRGTGAYGLVIGQTTNPVFQRLTYRLAGQGIDWLETTLTLPHDVPRLHISNRLHKAARMEKESVYFAFPFAGRNPRISFEITGGIAAPESPLVPGSARHFRAIRHWATVERDDEPTVAWATVQAPLVQVGNIHLPYAPFPTTIPEDASTPGTIYSWALNNIWDTNFPPQQGGEMRFDYVVATGAGTEPAILGRDTGAAAAQPLVGFRARSHDAATGLPDRGAFVTVADPAIEVTHLAQKAAGAMLVYIVSHAGEQVTTRLSFPGIPVARAWIGTFMGEREDPLDVAGNTFEISVGAGAMQRLRLEIDGG